VTSDLLDKNRSGGWAETRRATGLPARGTIIEVLAKAADDRKFLARLAENPYRVLQEYDLSEEERLVLARGDADKLEAWVGKLDARLSTWPKVRRGQNTW